VFQTIIVLEYVETAGGNSRLNALRDPQFWDCVWHMGSLRFGGGRSGSCPKNNMVKDMAM